MDGINQMPDQRLGGNQNRFEEFTFKKLAKVTDYFSHANILGDGGFGEVYKGKIGNRTVAIKKLKYNAADEQEGKEFLKEFQALGAIDHENLVKLIGYCCEGPNRLIVCEYCSNRSLRWHLHGGTAETLPWSTRLEIAIGSAKGIEYLHDHSQHRIIHRDIKPENIVLEPNFHAKVVDFGLAKFFPRIGNKTHISSLLRGTFAYADPEYSPNQRVSEKSDVYSFGVVLLELISGRLAETNDGDTIINWAKGPILQALGPENNITELIDPKLNKEETQLHENEIKMMICCAAASVYKQPSENRPQMKQIVQVLKMEIPSNVIWDMNADAASLST